MTRPFTVTLADLKANALADHKLSPRRRSDVVSGVDCYAKHLDKEPSDIVADFVWIRNFRSTTAKPHPGISKKTWANIRSQVKFAIRRYCLGVHATHRHRLSKHWLDLLEQLPDRRHRLALHRFATWCDRQDILPALVDQEVLQAFFAHLVNETMLGHPNRRYRDTCRYWNQAAERIPAWPKVQVTRPVFRNDVVLPREHFPASFWDDFERWRALLANTDPFSDEGPDKALKPVTQASMQQRVRRFASAIVRSGVPADQITDLAALVRWENFQSGVSWLAERCGDGPGLSIVVRTVIYIGKYHVKLAPDEIKRMQRVRRRLCLPNSGMTPKNKDRLRPLNDPSVELALHSLPERLVRAAIADTTHPRRAALLVQTALAIEWQLFFPLRPKNLAQLNRGQIRRTRTGKHGVVQVVMAKEDVKNEVPIEFELALSVRKLLDLYLERYRPVLLGDLQDNGWIFPGRNGGPKAPGYLSMQVKDLIREWTGLEIPLHLFRHIAGRTATEEEPGNYELARRLLHHKSIDTTTKYYTGFQSQAAAKRFEDIVLTRRGKPKPPKGRGPGPKRPTPRGGKNGPKKKI